MKRNTLGRSSVQVSEVGYGCMSLGHDHQENAKLLHRALELGVTLKELGEEPATVALAWLLHNPVVSAPIIGPRTMGQLESAVRATEVTLDEDTLTKLDEIFPGPGGRAPNAYAW